MLATTGMTQSYADPAVHIGFGRDYSDNFNKHEVGLLWNCGFARGNLQGWQTTLHWALCSIRSWSVSTLNSCVGTPDSIFLLQSCHRS